MSISIRTYQLDDLEDVVDLINAIDAIEKIEDGTSVEEMTNEIELPGVNATENFFVAEDQDGQLVGFAQARLFHEPTEDSFRSWFAVRPAFHQTDLGSRLLARLYVRAQERQAEFKSGVVTFNTIANALEHERINAIKWFGLHEIRRFWQMVRSLDAPIDEPRFPRGIFTRPYCVGADDERVNDAINEAFQDHFGHADTPIESWKHFVSQPFFRPELTLIAEDAQTHAIVGFSINLVNSKENERIGVARGWVDLLGVRRPWRQMGLGTAMLNQTMKNFRDARMRQVGLRCDSENTTGATRIYERVGFRVSKTRIAFSKPIRGSRVSEPRPDAEENVTSTR